MSVIDWRYNDPELEVNDICLARVKNKLDFVTIRNVADINNLIPDEYYEEGFNKEKFYEEVCEKVNIPVPMFKKVKDLISWLEKIERMDNLAYHSHDKDSDEINYLSSYGITIDVWGDDFDGDDDDIYTELAKQFYNPNLCTS